MFLLLAVIYLALLLFLWQTIAWRPRSVPGVTRKLPLLIGHRGVRGIKPENTLEAYRYALDEGLDGLEFDVQFSRDKELVLFHDFEIEGKQVASLSLAELRGIKPDIPVLTDLFELVRDYPETLLNLEIKSVSWRTDGLEREVVQAVRASGLADRVLVSSFNPVALLRIRLRAPRLRCGLLYSPDAPAWFRSGWLAVWLHVDALHPFESQVDAALVARAQSRGLAVNVWTVNDEMRITSLTELGVTAIIGDDPARLRRASSKA